MARTLTPFQCDKGGNKVTAYLIARNQTNVFTSSIQPLKGAMFCPYPTCRAHCFRAITPVKKKAQAIGLQKLIK